MDVKGRKKKKSESENKNWIGGHILYALAGAAVGLVQLPFGASPFGFAVICAVPRKRVLATAVGVCLSVFARTTDKTAFLICVGITLLIRAFLSLLSARPETGQSRLSGIFEEHISLRIVCAAIGGFSTGAWKLLTGGFLYYYLYGAIISILSAALAAALWVGVGDVLDEKYLSKYPPALKTLGFMSLCAAVVYGVSELSFYGISLPAFLCMFLSLTAMRKKGILYGSFLAMLTGLAVSVTYAPLFVFATVCYGFISGVSPLLGAVASFAVGMAWGVYTDGMGALTSLLAALLAANVLFLTVDRLYFVEERQPKSESCEKKTVDGNEQERLDVALARLDDTAGRIKLLCEGFSSLSGTLLGLDSAPPPLGGIGEYAQKVGRGLSVEIGELGESTEEEIPVGLYEDLWADEQRTRALALDYRALSDYLAGIMVENQKDYTVDQKLTDALVEELERSFGKGAARATAFGETAQRIIVTASEKEFFVSNQKELKRVTERVCGYSLKAGDVCESGESFYVIFRRVPMLTFTCAGLRKSSAAESDFCGDSFGTVCREDGGRLFAYISDGMGSGREAAATAELCTAFLQKLLPVNMSAGSPVESTLEMLNGFLRGINGSGMRECAATVDLGVIDLMDCRACFYKSGAAPTYVFRDGDLFKLKARTVPVGIVKEPDVGRISIELLPEDTVIMVSDGVTEGREECPELFELLQTRLLTHNAEQLAEAIMRYVDERGCSDDASVLVIKIKSA